jgi:hypothetical protein
MAATAVPHGRRAARTTRWLLVVLAVLLLHGGAVRWAGEAMVGWGAGDKPATERIDVAFVRALAPSAEPPPAPAAAVPRRAARARPPRPAASAPLPEPAASMPLSVVETLPQPPRDAQPEVQASAVPQAAPAVELPASAAAPAASAPSAPPFEWPPSTRLTYKLTGNYRGEVQGSARVQWVRLGERYQVHLDVVIGPSFAPLIARRMTSDGVIGDAGLVPQRYDEVTKLPFQAPRRAVMSFTPQAVTLANGKERDSVPGLQDSASQFVQLTWLFTTQPQLLKVGNAIVMPLALPRRMDRWIYDVTGEEPLYTPLGELATFHLKPRRAEARPRGELSAEVWFAPTLQYLPVRIRIEQDPETYVDLVMDAAPLQAAPEQASPAR